MGFVANTMFFQDLVVFVRVFLVGQKFADLFLCGFFFKSSVEDTCVVSLHAPFQPVSV